ncbi:MAG: acyl-CoA/acyl-ACP dehydrogenase [Armatimonadetes bacterium]|nr:acyl-CoA/acyl-ACP dehydrogenase [Armatimonadota bacterium]
MDFTPDATQSHWHERAQAFAREVLAPRAAEVDSQSRFPYENFRDIRREGLLNIGVPSAFGGHWADHVTYALMMEALAEGCPSTACCMAMHAGACLFLRASANPVQKKRYFRWVVEDGYLLAVAFNDASPYEDAPPVRVTAQKGPGGYRLHGHKYFATSAGAADLLLVLADTDCGPRIFAVSGRNRDDVRVEEGSDSLGLRGTTSYAVAFEGCWVPEEDMLGPIPETGLWRCQPSAGFGLGLAAVSSGIAGAALEYTLNALRKSSRSIEGHDISQERRRLLARMYTGTENARQMLRYAAWMADRSEDDFLLSLLAARQTCNSQAVMVTQDALLAVGTRGYLTRTPLERLIRDALAGPLQAGCHESCPEQIARELLCLG